MPVIRANNFGGVLPAASPRALPEGAAQVARDILPSTSEFRPVLGPGTPEATANAVSNPATIYKYHQVGGSWYGSSEIVNIVRGQVNDDPNERTYVSRQNGSAAPQIFPSGLPLGVPAPTLAPTVLVNNVTQFTADMRSSAIAAAGLDARDSVHDNLQLAVGCAAALTSDTGLGPNMGMAVPGYFVRSLDPTAGDAATQVGRALRATSTGGAFDGGFETAYVDSNINTADNWAWALDPRLQGYWQSMPSVSVETSPWGTTWGTVTGDDHWVVPFNAFTRTIELDRAAAETALAAIPLPGGSVGEHLYTSGEVAVICDTVEAYLSPTAPAIAPKLDEMAVRVKALKGWLDGGALAFSKPTLESFYSGISGDITDSITAFANSIADLAINVANARTVITGNEGGGA